ncbi:ATP-binding protein [Ramlibacter sp. MMS24-I3-19]|uniref:ATP-binding protein n=1 Tax=Ramlibacter sp. MMS24-I3-19 TaxID=3416606 RepID=UPI003CFEE857
MYKIHEQTPLIVYAGMQVAWDRITEIHKDFTENGNVQNFQILGISGQGKSTMARTYAEQYPPSWDGSTRRRRVVYFSVPPAPTPVSMFAALCKAFGGPTVGTAMELLDRAIGYSNGTGCELLLSDEVHHYLDRGQQRSHAQLGDYWKTFHDHYKGVTGLIGAPRIRDLLAVNKQWKNRAGEDLVLRPFSYDCFEHDLGGFIASVVAGTALEAHLAFLADADILTRIQYATDGVPKHVIDFVVRVGRKFSKGAQLDIGLLDREWNFMPGMSLVAEKRRPFHKDFVFERLDQLGEPFSSLGVDGDNHAFY